MNEILSMHPDGSDIFLEGLEKAPSASSLSHSLTLSRRRPQRRRHRKVEEGEASCRFLIKNLHFDAFSGDNWRESGVQERERERERARAVETEADIRVQLPKAAASRTSCLLCFEYTSSLRLLPRHPVPFCFSPHPAKVALL